MDGCLNQVLTEKNWFEIAADMRNIAFSMMRGRKYSIEPMMLRHDRIWPIRYVSPLAQKITLSEFDGYREEPM
jgi:hypothetical protein